VLKVVMFTGGRGSSVLSVPLLSDRRVDLVLAINGYDDGGSTGEVRRFLGDTLGPSDYRKNAARVAAAKRSCSAALIQLLDSRLPTEMSAEQALARLDPIAAGGATDATLMAGQPLPESEAASLAGRLAPFLQAYRDGGRPFVFADCAIGNLVFAGCYLRQDRRFNRAIDDYAALLGLPPGLIENVTDGDNAHLVALDSNGRVLGTEEEIVTAPNQDRIEDLFLIDAPLGPEECRALEALGPAETRRRLEARSADVRSNPRLIPKIRDADVIVYAPGTQHSSLYPSYLTPGVADRIAENLRATKLLITNLESDVEITRENAVSLVERALHYLTDRSRRPIPAPCLVTHYLMNDPDKAGPGRPLVPLGQVELLEDPRLIRIGYYEDGVTGRHDASKVLEPFMTTRLEPPVRPRIAVLLYGTESPNKIVQTLIEMSRAGHSADGELTVFAKLATPPTRAFRSRLPFALETAPTDAEIEWLLQIAVDAHEFDYVALFESSGLYRGEDLVLAFHFLVNPRVDAVWGSRRLSIKDINDSYARRRDQSAPMRGLSRAGSHALSLSYLLLYGRYITDTLSGVRIVRASEIPDVPVSLMHPTVNQHLLSRLLRCRADVLEVPVQYIPAPRMERAMSVAAGIASMATIAWQKLAPFADLPGIEL
jgi:2-phospho-L-lactate transferase/gluconeogenesis factor (CofD/UPF0052 family)